MSKNRIIGGFEDAVERGQAAATNATKQAVSDVAGTVKGQLTGSQGSAPSDSSGNGTNEHGVASQNQQNPQMTDADRVEFLKNLYGKSDSSQHKDKPEKPKNAGSLTQALGIPEKDPNAGKSPEEIAKIEALRKQLHSDYYQNLVNRPKPKEEPVAEKLEREEQEEQFEEIQKQKEKPQALPATVKQGTAESVVGVAG